MTTRIICPECRGEGEHWIDVYRPGHPIHPHDQVMEWCESCEGRGRVALAEWIRRATLRFGRKRIVEVTR